MKKLLLASIFILNITVSNAQVPDWNWAVNFPNKDNESPGRSAIDSKGNMYMIGSFTGDTLQLGTTTLLRKAKRNFFITKLNPMGIVLWAKAAGTSESSSYHEATSIAIDPFDNIYVCGAFTRADFKSTTSITFDSIDLKSSILDNVFIAKYDASGNVIWAEKKAGHYLMQVSAIQTDRYGAIYMAGIKSSDTTSEDNYIALKHMYLDAYKPTGELKYSKTFLGNARTYSIAIQDSAMYVSGGFTGPNLIIKDTLINTNTSQNDGFFSKMNLSGTVAWSKSIRGTGAEFVLGSCIDSKGNLCITGSYGWGDYSIFETDTLNNAAPFEFDLYVAKYDPTGKLTWVRNTKGVGSRWGYDITVNPNDNLYVAAGFFNKLYFNGDTLTTIKKLGADADAMVLKYTKGGTPLWVKTFHGESYEDIKTIIRDPNTGNILVFGESQSDTLTIGKTVLVNALPLYGIDLFLTTFQDELITSVSENEKTSSTNYQLIPNPTKNQFYVRVEDKQNVVNEITVFNIYGQIVYTKKGTIDTTVNVSEWVKGLYMVYMAVGSEHVVRKLVVQ